MLTVFGLGFTQPFLLLGFFALPVFWWLARILPPPPTVVHFPAIRFLSGLSAQNSTAKFSPPWLVLLRALIISLIILGLSRPVINPSNTLKDADQIIIIVDNSWGSAENWSLRERTITSLVQAARRTQTPVTLLPTTLSPDETTLSPLGPMPAARLLDQLPSIQPQPWSAHMEQTIAALKRITISDQSQIFWLSDKITALNEEKLENILMQFPQVTTYVGQEDVHLLSTPVTTEKGLSLQIQKSDGAYASTVRVALHGAQNQIIAQQPVDFAAGETVQNTQFDLPLALRNEITRISIIGINSAGATIILDQSWKMKSVGILSRDRTTSERPLLQGQYYVARAMTPFAEVTTTPLPPLIDSDVPLIVEASGSRFQQSEQDMLLPWVQQGGVLLRFAGRRLSVVEEDPLLPVTLRTGGRLLGSTLSWDKPISIAPFSKGSLFEGLEIPQDVRITQQILAEPTTETEANTWATLEDGTPLITGKKIGKGWVVLFHVTANAEWSNLPLSGLFPQLLERLTTLADGKGAKDHSLILYPLRAMNGFGALLDVGAAARPINLDMMDTMHSSPIAPPGIYGNGDRRIALNLADFAPKLGYTDPEGNLGRQTHYRDVTEIDLMGILLFAALLLFLVETCAVMLVRRTLARRLLPSLPQGSQKTLGSKGVGKAGLMIGLATLLTLNAPLSSESAHANQSMSKQDKILAAVQETHLAYIMTGDGDVDKVTQNGLRGLSELLVRRTAVEPLNPIGLDINEDELQVWPLVYWPITKDMAPVPEETISRLNTYLRTGGTILFDTRDELFRQANGLNMVDTPNGHRLSILLDRLDVPPLVPVPTDHVLSRTFYLLQEFPGRYTGGHVWIEQRDEADYDGVSGLVIGSHDWASAWAIDDLKRHPFAVVPGGETQREHAYRFGVNLVMYVLTGNYKSDQVHVPAILERLGH